MSLAGMESCGSQQLWEIWEGRTHPRCGCLQSEPEEFEPEGVGSGQLLTVLEQNHDGNGLFGGSV